MLLLEGLLRLEEGGHKSPLPALLPGESCLGVTLLDQISKESVEMNN